MQKFISSSNSLFRSLLTLNFFFLLAFSQAVMGQYSAPGYRAEGEKEKTATPSLEAQAKTGQAPLSLLRPEVDWATVRALRLKELNATEQQLPTDKKKFRIGLVRSLPQSIASLSDLTKLSTTDGTLYLLRIASPKPLRCAYIFKV